MVPHRRGRFELSPTEIQGSEALRGSIPVVLGGFSGILLGVIRRAPGVAYCNLFPHVSSSIYIFNNLNNLSKLCQIHREAHVQRYKTWGPPGGRFRGCWKCFRDSSGGPGGP